MPSFLVQNTLILYVQNLVRRQCPPDVGGLQLLQGRGEPSAMPTTEGVSSPYALSIFRYRRKHLDAVRAEPHTRRGFVMLHHPYFYV